MRELQSPDERDPIEPIGVERGDNNPALVQ